MVLVKDKSLETLVVLSVKETAAITGQINCSKQDENRESKWQDELPSATSFLSVLVPRDIAHIQCESSHANQSNQDTSSGRLLLRQF